LLLLLLLSLFVRLFVCLVATSTDLSKPTNIAASL
jgi:hypothetical protein